MQAVLIHLCRNGGALLYGGILKCLWAKRCDVMVLVYGGDFSSLISYKQVQNGGTVTM